MNRLFADTSYYVALLNDSDEAHQRAVALSEGLRLPIVTTEYILLEVANWMCGSRDRRMFESLWADLCADHTTTIVPSSSSLFREGVILYVDRPDKEWSLTDCISFVVMQNEGLREALSTDHHFEQAGFAILLK